MKVRDRECPFADGVELTADARQRLDDDGFVVLPGPISVEDLERFAIAYDAAVEKAGEADTSVGSSTTRITDFVNRGPEFDGLYMHLPLLASCHHVIKEPFKLSTMHARTLRACSTAQNLHVDFERNQRGWPIVGFIVMVDEFRKDNGATRFIPGSHLWLADQRDLLRDRLTDYPGQVLACGSAGSMIVYNGSVWHGHTANSSEKPRRSLQGAFIRRDLPSSVNLLARMRAETLARISPLAKYLLAV